MSSAMKLPAKRTQPAACQCGQVLFEVADRQVGETLSCSWCERKYRFLGGDQIELVGAVKKQSARIPLFSIESGEDVARASADETVDQIKIPDRSKRVFSKKNATERIRTEPGESTKKSRRRSGEIPGGIGPMIAFMVGFNGLAFVIVQLLITKDAGGVRESLLGFKLAPNAIWPEISALVVGQIFGFIAWAIFAYQHEKKRKAAQLEAEAQAKT